MPNILKTVYSTWVKNVYSLRTTRGTTSKLLSTVTSRTNDDQQRAVHKLAVILNLVHQFKTYLSTTKIRRFNLLYSDLYPQSTPPINKRNKEK